MSRILQIITGLGYGGAEKELLELCKNSAFNMDVVSLSETNDMFNLFEEEGIPVHRLLLKKKVSDLVKAIRHFTYLVKEMNVKVLHAHMYHSLLVSSCIKLLVPKIKVIFTSHNVQLESRIREFIIWILKPFRDADVVFSNEILRFYSKNKYFIIPNGIDTDNYHFRKEKSESEIFTFINVARLSPAKDQESLLVEYRKLLNRNSEYERKTRLLIVGEGDLSNHLKKRATELRLNNVFFLGLRKDIPDLLMNADCFVLSSKWEGLPLVIIEAGACGLPIISTRVGSIPSVLTEENSYCCETAEISEMMERVYNNYDEAKKRGKLLREKIIRDYDIKVVAKKHDEIYRAVILEKE